VFRPEGWRCWGQLVCRVTFQSTQWLHIAMGVVSRYEGNIDATLATKVIQKIYDEIN
jgi:hypothetical protein